VITREFVKERFARRGHDDGEPRQQKSA